MNDDSHKQVVTIIDGYKNVVSTGPITHDRKLQFQAWMAMKSIEDQEKKLVPHMLINAECSLTKDKAELHSILMFYSRAILISSRIIQMDLFTSVLNVNVQSFKFLSTLRYTMW